MKNFTFLCLTVLVSLGTFAAPKYLVETGKDGDATWSVLIADATKVNLTTENKTLDEWMNETFASGGYETWIAAGTYTISTGISVYSGSIKLYGGFAGTETNVNQRATNGKPWDMVNATILDANSKHLYSAPYSQSWWDGLTITNSAGKNGGVARIASNVEIRNCRFVNNSSTDKGGVLYTYNHDNILVSDCYFEGNSSAQGGAIFVQDATDSYSFVIDHCYFKDNDATQSSGNAGGALCFLGSDAYVYKINACVFVDNNASNSGNGTAICSAGTSSATTITNSLFYHQKNSSKPAIYLLKGSILNCTFASNAGGALYMGGAAYTGRFENNIIWGADDTECNISIVDNANYTFKNNAVGKMIAPTNAARENNLYLTKGDKSYFKSADTGDFHLTSGATEKMVGRGRDLSGDGVTKDLDGLTRFVYDIGCYMYPSPAGCDNCFYVQP